MTLSFRSTSRKPPIFTMTNNSYTDRGAFWGETDPNHVESVLGKVHQLSDWFRADFVVAGYVSSADYPNLDNTILRRFESNRRVQAIYHVIKIVSGLTTRSMKDKMRSSGRLEIS